MKRIRVLITAILASVVLVSGCVDSGSILTTAQDDFSVDLTAFELENEGKVPKSVLDTLDFMLENYTDGIAKPTPEEVKGPEITPDQLQTIVDNPPDRATTKDEVKAIILKAMRNTEPGVTITMDKSIFSSDMIYEVIYEEIGGTYIVDSLGSANQWKYSYTQIPGTNDYAVVMTFCYFQLPHYDHGFTTEQVKQMKIELQNKADQIVSDLNLKSMNEYEIVKAVNEYLCDTVTYSSGKSPYTPMQYTPYGALMNGDCVCEGYAKAAQLLFTLSGVESYFVPGDTPGGGHAWNIVKVDNKYYQLDITWNDNAQNPNLYFLVTDDYMTLTRTWEKSKYPKTASTPY